MKNYKALVPIVLVFLFVISVYMIYDGKASSQGEYEAYLKAAREYRKHDIQIDAEENYMNALAIEPSLELYVEIGEFYLEASRGSDAEDWGEAILEEYPNEAAGYEFLANYYALDEDYAELFGIAETARKRKISSKTLDKIEAEHQYRFFLNGRYSDVGVYAGGICPVKSKELWGYANVSGARIIDCKYLKAGYYFGDLAAVVDVEGRAFYIDPAGNKKKVMDKVKNLQELGMLVDGIFPAYDGKSWSYYDQNQKQILKGYEDVSVMVNGVAAVKKDNVWSLVDKKGKNITGKTYDGVVMDERKVAVRNDRTFVYYNFAYYMLNSSGKKIGEKYEDAKLFNDDTYAAVKKDGNWGFVDAKGKIVIEPQFNDARSFSNGLAAVKVGGLWGFIDSKGNMVIEPQFNDAKDFTDDGSVFVLIGNQWQLLRLYKFNHN